VIEAKLKVALEHLARYEAYQKVMKNKTDSGVFLKFSAEITWIKPKQFCYIG